MTSPSGTASGANSGREWLASLSAELAAQRRVMAGLVDPWHGLSQVLDHDPENLPPGIESTVARLDRVDLRRAAQASATVLAQVSAAAAQRCPAELPSAMARYVTDALSRDERDETRGHR